jgi:hypothetical protein
MIHLVLVLNYNNKTFVVKLCHVPKGFLSASIFTSKTEVHKICEKSPKSSYFSRFSEQNE